jgi:hypothetical protein
MSLRDAGLAFMSYFYFDFRNTDKQDRRNLLLSLLSLLSARSNICCDMLYRIYLTHDNGTHKPTDDVLGHSSSASIITRRVSQHVWVTIPQRISPRSREGAYRTFPPTSSYMCHQPP